MHEAARTRVCADTEKAPSVAGGACSGNAICYRMRPGDDPPELVVAVVIDMERRLRIRAHIASSLPLRQWRLPSF
ncbi:hypothetical protein BRADO3293 [Bradyrhizobium sp. ORS 278]|nr:hypothetical protein BRADO3293 [Bradyrhizobium sp. ORS 278]